MIKHRLNVFLFFGGIFSLFCFLCYESRGFQPEREYTSTYVPNEVLVLRLINNLTI